MDTVVKSEEIFVYRRCVRHYSLTCFVDSTCHSDDKLVFCERNLLQIHRCCCQSEVDWRSFKSDPNIVSGRAFLKKPYQCVRFVVSFLFSYVSPSFLSSLSLVLLFLERCCLDYSFDTKALCCLFVYFKKTHLYFSSFSLLPQRHNSFIWIIYSSVFWAMFISRCMIWEENKFNC